MLMFYCLATLSETIGFCCGFFCLVVLFLGGCVCVCILFGFGLIFALHSEA